MSNVHGPSQAEDIIYGWLCESYEVERNNKNLIKAPSGHWMELDLYIPSIGIAIESDGSRYHKEGDLTYNKWQLMVRGGKSKGLLPKWKGYHQWKDTKCAEQGIKLLHICSEDVIDYPDQTRNYIMEELDKWQNLTKEE